MERFSFEQAEIEEARMKEKIESGKAKNYPEAEGQVAEEMAQKFLSEHKPDPEVEGILGRVNFPLIQKLIADRAVKAGISRNKINFVGKERIYQNTSLPLGQFVDEGNLIGIYLPATKNSEYAGARERNSELYGSREIKLIHMLIHEETHAASRHLCISALPMLVDPSSDEFAKRWLEDPREQESFPNFMELHLRSKQLEKEQVRKYKQSGYARNILDEEEKEIYFPKEGVSQPSRYTLFGVLNEGVVEKLARQLTLLYLPQSGMPKDDINQYKNNIEGKHDELVYSYEVALIDAIVKKIVSVSQINEDVVWGALVRGLFEGETFSDPEVKKLFEETFGSDFLVELSQLQIGLFASYDNSMRKILEKYGLQKPTNELGKEGI
ncbi:MAG: hypothetical protein Q8L47_00975 [bacterium]|nr:hypothetical protein [bacterium]